MLFTSSQYFVLIGVATTLYYLKASVRWQLGVALAASAVFYGWSQPWLLLLLLASATITSCVSFAAAFSSTALKKRLFSTLGVVLNLGILAFFKYAGLFSSTLLPVQSSPAEFLIHIPLPLGISFYTFRGISLMVDTFRKDFDAQEMFAPKLKSFFSFYARSVFFIIFFPQLIAGPISKAKDFMPQIQPKYFKDIPWYPVVRLLIVGYFLKCYCANNLQNITFWMQYPWFVNTGPSHTWTLMIAYSLQIFADFAGYSLIAIGSAALFGYQVPQNFNFPYIAESFSDFWRRWHISLSSWLRDYLYIPLGGNRKTSFRTYSNIFLVMALGGLWHGSQWSYMAWGACHGLFLMAERPLLKRGLIESVPRAVRMSVVFLCVTMCWLFFKFSDISHVFEFIKELFSPWGMMFKEDFQLGFVVFYFALPVVLYHFFYLKKRPLKPLLQDGLLGLMLYMITCNGESSVPFIYFRF